MWVKTNGGQGSFYRSQHEHIAVYVAGTAHRPTISGLANGAVTERTSGVMLALIRLDGTAPPP